MSFLQPWVLAALPLIALPILIHLINRNRHRTVDWGAMMFLVKANRMNKGMARLRYVFIMLLRMLAVVAIIFAIGRPLLSGNLGGLSMGRPDATLILVDRSASMEMQDLQSGESKRSTALNKLSELLEKRRVGNRLVLIDSATGKAHEIESPATLRDLPLTKPTSTSANIPSMLETSLAYLKANEAGRADVWICSDLQENDWATSSGRWTAIRDQFAEMKGVQHFLLSYAQKPTDNLSIRVANAKRRLSGSSAELVMDVFLAGNGSAQKVPVEFAINNTRSIVEMEVDAAGASLLGHTIPIDPKLQSGWGSVTLPNDSNPLDNRFYFVFSEPPVRKATIVTDNTKIGDAFQRCLSIPSESGLQHEAEIFTTARAAEIDWQATALLVWKAPFPEDQIAEKIEEFVNAGRVALFFPPDEVSDRQLFGSTWSVWTEVVKEEQRKLSWWRTDADLLANTGSGDALPLSELRTYQYCALERTVESRAFTPLAKLNDGSPLLTRAATDRGAVYFCSTVPTANFSSLERDAVSFYVMLQRALTNGTAALVATSQRESNVSLTEELNGVEAIAPTENAPTVSERALQPGVYRKGDDWIALNRSLKEDDAKAAPLTKVDQLFEGLAYERIDDAIGNSSSLASEIWRAFLFLMVGVLILEAVLCMPEKRQTSTNVTA